MECIPSHLLEWNFAHKSNEANLFALVMDVYFIDLNVFILLYICIYGKIIIVYVEILIILSILI